jgi:predicted DNA-binding transcriptional regulator AlpA
MTQRILRSEKGRKAEDQGLLEQIKKIEGQVSTWYARHDQTESEIAKEAAWVRIQQLSAEKQRLEAAKHGKESAAEKVTRVTKAQIAKYLGSLSHLLTNYGGDDAKQYIHSLAAHHGLSVQMAGPQSLSISLAIKSPGTMNAETVSVSATVAMPKNKITVWLEEQKGKHVCTVCHKPVTVERRHFWRGVPKFHRKCWASTALIAKRLDAAGNMLTGGELARRLGVGRTTIGRWLKSGKLPPPDRRTAKLLLWHPSVIDRLKPIR